HHRMTPGQPVDHVVGTEPFDPILTPLFFIRSLHQGVSNEELGAMYRDVLSKQFTSTNSIAHAKRPSVAHSPELLTKRLIDSASPLAHFLVSQLLYSQFSSLRALENVLFVTDEHQPAYREVFENVRRLYGEEHYELFISRLDDYLQPIGEPGPKAVDSSSTISNIGSTSHRPSPIRLRHLRLEQIFLSNDRTEARELLTELHRILIDEVSIHPTLKRWAVPRHTVTPPASSVVLFLRHFLMSGPLFQEYVVEDIASRSTITTHSSAAISTRLKRLSELASNRSPKNTDPEQEWSFLKFWNLLLQIDVNYSHLPSYEDILITAGIKPFDISLEYRTLRDIWEEIYSRATEQQLTAILTTVSNFEQFRQKKDLSHTVRSKLTATATLKKNNLSKPFSEFASPVLITLFTYLRNSLDEMTSHFISAANPFLEQLAQWLEIKYSPRTHDINQIFDEAMEIVRKRIKLNETLPPAGAILQWTSFVHPNKIHLLGKELLDGAFPRLPPRSETLLAMLENFTALHQNKSVGVYLDREILAVFLLALARPDSREKA
ncbi:MAG TPA: hypothetical protein PLH57_10505, partial [Oligoflexia bacterium]|nr:hypothetical protein [Oligoflexia bacterium]